MRQAKSIYTQIDKNLILKSSKEANSDFTIFYKMLFFCDFSCRGSLKFYKKSFAIIFQKLLDVVFNA